MGKGLYFAYQKAWRKENPANKYDLTPGAALMLRTIIDEVNAHFWPITPIRIENQYFRDTCNIKNRETLKRYRDQLIKKGLITWHKDVANPQKSGFYQLRWVPETVQKEIDKQINDAKNVTPPCLKLATTKG